MPQLMKRIDDTGCEVRTKSGDPGCVAGSGSKALGIPIGVSIGGAGEVNTPCQQDDPPV